MTPAAALGFTANGDMACPACKTAAVTGERVCYKCFLSLPREEMSSTTRGWICQSCATARGQPEDRPFELQDLPRSTPWYLLPWVVALFAIAFVLLLAWIVWTSW